MVEFSVHNSLFSGLDKQLKEKHFGYVSVYEIKISEKGYNLPLIIDKKSLEEAKSNYNACLQNKKKY